MVEVHFPPTFPPLRPNSTLAEGPCILREESAAHPTPRPCLPGPQL